SCRLGGNEYLGGAGHFVMSFDAWPDPDVSAVMNSSAEHPYRAGSGGARHSAAGWHPGSWTAVRPAQPAAWYEFWVHSSPRVINDSVMSAARSMRNSSS